MVLQRPPEILISQAFRADKRLREPPFTLRDVFAGQKITARDGTRENGLAARTEGPGSLQVRLLATELNLHLVVVLAQLQARGRLGGDQRALNGPEGFQGSSNALSRWAVSPVFLGQVSAFWFGFFKA